MNRDETFNWKRFHAYRVFDEFLERFVIQRKSYVTDHSDFLDLGAAFEDIRERFVAAFDDSNAHFDEKLAVQFEGAAKQTKIVFANIEYLWAMPMANITPKRKRSYSVRWFPESNRVVSGERYFFSYPNNIANPGSWYLRNKYWEMVAALRVLNLLTAEPNSSDLTGLKQRIAEICHAAIYEGIPAEENFAVSKVCGLHSALMHLADPERYESIISASHRRQICAVFQHVVESPSDDEQVLIKQIRETLYNSHGNDEETDGKHRWFFYSKDVLPLWIDKKSKKAQHVSSAIFDVRLEENASDLEGGKDEIRGYRIRRSAKLVKEAKRRDGYSCRACKFHFKDQIVHVHHLDPLSEYLSPKETTLDDLITLCPNCHYLAHYWLRKDALYKKVKPLLSRLCRGLSR